MFFIPVHKKFKKMTHNSVFGVIKPGAGPGKQKLFKTGYPPLKAVALRRFYGFATAIFLKKDY
jgi:hypothetical protein